MEERFRGGTLSDGQNNIPIQMMSLTERDGRITPQWFRLETEEHEIRLYRIEQVVSRDEKRYVGIGRNSLSARSKWEICEKPWRCGTMSKPSDGVSSNSCRDE